MWEFIWPATNRPRKRERTAAAAQNIKLLTATKGASFN